VVEVLV
jgi:hypothetical protein